MPQYPKPTSCKFDPDANSWVIASRNETGNRPALLMQLINELFDYTNVSTYYTKRQVHNTCLEFGYFGFGNFAISYLPQSNTSSLDLIKGDA